MQVYVVLHGEVGLIGVFASEGAWERYAERNEIDPNDPDYEGEWDTVET